MYSYKYAPGLVAALKKVYPDAACSLHYDGEPWKLLVTAMLSAQCTDARVNLVSGNLFAAFPDVPAMAAASVPEIEDKIRSCGLYHTKAKNIKAACEALRDNFGGKVPPDMDDLLSLPGVGRKIANLVRGDVFGLPAVVCDTHCIRLSGRMGLVGEGVTDPAKVEKVLAGEIEPSEQSDFCHRLVLFGREYCTARSPRCGECPVQKMCRKRICETEKK